MQVFIYSKSWADLMVTQLTAGSGSGRAEAWGYSCLCIGRNFEDVLERRYEEIDLYSGKYLHIFSLLPPPRKFLNRRIAALRQEDSLQAEWLREKLLELLNDRYLYAYRRSDQIHEKVRLLRDLADDGLNVDEYADFLFFDYRLVLDETHVDVIAVKQSPMERTAKDEEFIKLFGRMGELATELWERGASAEDYVRLLDKKWARRLALRRARNLARYIFDFQREVSRR
jgi:hypothetical protein